MSFEKGMVVGMDIQVLVAAMFQDSQQLVNKMNLSTDAIIINQCDSNAYEELEHAGKQIRYYSMKERGVGLSRNTALMRADHEISLFSDEDIVFHEHYGEMVQREFEVHPEADMIVFNFAVSEERRTYYNANWHRVYRHNCGRYPTFSFAIRTEQMHRKNITYSLLFGGGAKYSNGEDSLFIRECIQKGLKVYASPVELGKEAGGESTWFSGYHEKFFVDRGVLYHYLYGKLAVLLAIRFLVCHRAVMCKEIPLTQALSYMKRGIREAKQ